MTDPTTTISPPDQQSPTVAEQAKEHAAEQVQQVAGQAKEQVSNLAGQARSQVDERSTQYGQKVTEHASSVRSVADHLRSEGKDSEARYAEQAAERIERAGSWLTESDADKILREVEDFGRRRPWAVIGAGIVIGVAASRMLKASSSQRYEGGGSQVSTTPRGLPQGTGLQDTTAAVPTTPTTPRTDAGTWSANGDV